MPSSIHPDGYYDPRLTPTGNINSPNSGSENRTPAAPAVQPMRQDYSAWTPAPPESYGDEWHPAHTRNNSSSDISVGEAARLRASFQQRRFDPGQPPVMQVTTPARLPRRVPRPVQPLQNNASYRVDGPSNRPENYPVSASNLLPALQSIQASDPRMLYQNLSQDALDAIEPLLRDVPDHILADQNIANLDSHRRLREAYTELQNIVNQYFGRDRY
jgi:hypothetical protein